MKTSLPEAPRPDTREVRALELFRARGRQIERLAPGVYSVPSQDGLRSYRVEYGGEVEACTCPDHQYRGENCVHILAVAIYRAKRRGAAARRLRVLEDRYEHEDLAADERLQLLDEIRALRRRARA